MVHDARQTERRSILLVEDDADARELYATHLRRAGHYVLEAATLGAANDVLRACVPDVIVLDRHLPDGDGIDLARTVTKSGAKAISIVLITASRESSIATTALEAGCDAFLRKPFPLGALALHVEHALIAAKPTRRLSITKPEPSATD